MYYNTIFYYGKQVFKAIFKLRFFLLCCVGSFLSSNTIAQQIESPTVQFLAKRGYIFPDTSFHIPDSLKKWPDTVYYNTPYKPKRMGSLTIPISFSSIEISKGNYEVSPTVSLGLGYTWFFGDFIFSETDKVIVNPTVFYGLIANAGLENNFSLDKLASFLVGGFIGVGSFTLFGGYDVINKSPSLGVGGRIDLFTISQKFLHIYGRVHPVRKHKKIAPPVTME